MRKTECIPLERVNARRVFNLLRENHVEIRKAELLAKDGMPPHLVLELFVVPIGKWRKSRWLPVGTKLTISDLLLVRCI